MKTILITILLLMVSTSVYAQTVAPFVFGEEYRNIDDMDVMGEKVAVISSNDAIPTGRTKPLHLAIYENEQWTKVSPYFLNKGVEDTVRASTYPKLSIAPNGDIWIAAVYLYQYSNGNWKKHHIENFDTTVINRTYELIQVTNEKKLMVFSRVNGGGDIFTIDLENPDVYQRNRKFRNLYIGPNTNHPYRSVFEVDGYTLSQTSRSYDIGNDPDIYINTPDDTILTFTLPTPNGEYGGRRIMQMFAESKDEIWILTDNSNGKVKKQDNSNKDSSYSCCAGIYILRNLKDWEVVSDVDSYPVNLKNGLKVAPVGANKIRYDLYEFLLGNNPNIPNNELKNSLYLYNTNNRTFTLTNWDVIIKNSTGYRSSNNRPTEYQLALILENFTKNIANGDYFLKMKMDSKGNRWFMAQSYVVQVPPIDHPTSVSELDMNQQFRIVPNPATQSISLKGKIELIQHIEILNLQGETLIKVEGEFNNISIRPFANGVYFVRKIFKDGSEEFSKFVKE